LGVAVGRDLDGFRSRGITDPDIPIAIEREVIAGRGHGRRELSSAFGRSSEAATPATTTRCGRRRRCRLGEFLRPDIEPHSLACAVELHRPAVR
jgi:hypothetical protein